MQDTLDRKNQIAMKLLHYFITEENYNPVVLQGAEDEIWLENLNGDYKIIRIVSNHILNDEQLQFDLFKTKHVVKKIKKKTLTFKIKVLSIFTDIDEDVELDNERDIDCISVYDEKDLGKYNEVKETFPNLMKKIKFSEEGVSLFMKITSDINQKNKEDSVKVDEVFKKKIPFVTYGLMAINTIIFVWMYLLGNADSFIQEYAVHGYSIIERGEYYRLITGAFLHGGITHFLFNMYALYILGTQLEGFIGKTRYTIVYFFSILTASLLSIILNRAASVGASGAIFGILGSLLYFGYHYRVYLGGVIKSQILPIIFINLLLGFLGGGNVDNWAHIGGLIGGFLITIGVGIKYKSSNFERINGMIVSLLVVAFLIFIALNYVVFS